MKHSKQKAFTLVELIVVIVILGILWTIGFVSYSGYLWGARDSNRISQLKGITDSLNLYNTKNTLPFPDDYVTVTASWTTIWYQGYAGANILELINYTNGWKDPKDGDYFTYYLSSDKKSFQLLAFLEETDGLQSYVPALSQTHAADLSNRHPKVYGTKLGVLTQSSSNIPIQEVPTVLSAGSLDMVLTTDSYDAHITDTSIISGTGWTLSSVQNLSIAGGLIAKSCKELLSEKPGLLNQDGTYLVNIDGIKIEGIYCDMTTDWWGWTFSTMLVDMTTKNLFKTENTNKIKKISSEISTKWQISNIWIDDDNKDIMIKCVTNQANDLNKYNTPFIVYGFKKSDINNLEKSTKQAATFSSVNLNAKWNWNNYTLSTNYNWSGDSNSFYLKENSIWKTLFWSYASNGIHSWISSWHNDSPAYSTSDLSKWFDVANYCMTAIR